MSDHKARARMICDPAYFGGQRSDDAQHVKDVAEALRTVRRETLEECANLCERYRHDSQTFGAVPTDPMLAISVSAHEIAQAIRSLAVKEGEG
jgi:threonine synthase